VQLSDDGATWSAPVAEGRGDGQTTTIAFAPRRARFVRLTLTRTPDEGPAPVWAIQQLKLYEVR
jgi:hypothetical protein